MPYPGFFLALLLERCFFVDFPFYNHHFAHELDFSWRRHQQRLLTFGHDPNATESQPERIPGGYETIGGTYDDGTYLQNTGSPASAVLMDFSGQKDRQ